MEHHFFQPQLEFRDELLKGNVIPLRPLFYAKPIHSHFALLAFFMTEDPEVTEFLSEYPWIEEAGERTLRPQTSALGQRTETAQGWRPALLVCRGSRQGLPVLCL
jgi:hypothetical protein